MSDNLPARLAAGDAAAYQQAYDRYGPALFRAAWRMLDSRHDAEDAVQELFGAMVRSRHRLKHVADLKAYLFASLRHVTARIRHRRHGTAGLEDAAISVACPLEDREDAEALWALVRRLPAEQREVVALKTQGDLTFRQIGAACGISPNTAASRYRYALEKLKRMLEARE